jgi:hypothetical protein
MRPDRAAKGALTGSEIDTAVTRGNKQAFRVEAVNVALVH